MTTTKTRDEVRNAAEMFVARLNAEAQQELAHGRKPLYTTFGYEMGQKHARIFSMCGSSRSARAFVCNDGTIKRADSWKASGRILGATYESADAFAYVLGPIFGGAK